MIEDKYEVKLTPIAYEDLDKIYDYISRELHNNDAAVSLMDKFEHDIMRLSIFPFSGGKVRDELLNQKNYRKLIVNNYIIFYIVNEIDKTVIIMRVLYGSRLHRDLI